MGKEAGRTDWVKTGYTVIQSSSDEFDDYRVFPHLPYGEEGYGVEYGGEHGVQYRREYRKDSRYGSWRIGCV